MKIKFRHFQNATYSHGCTIAWQTEAVVMPSEKDNYSPYFIVNVGISFQNSSDQFSRKTGREIALDRIKNHQMRIRLYSDETVDHALFREVRRLTVVEAINYKIPQKAYNDIVRMSESPAPFIFETERKQSKNNQMPTEHSRNKSKISKISRAHFRSAFENALSSGNPVDLAITIAIEAARLATKSMK
jgi:hypothetical protein